MNKTMVVMGILTDEDKTSLHKLAIENHVDTIVQHVDGEIREITLTSFDGGTPDVITENGEKFDLKTNYSLDRCRESNLNSLDKYITQLIPLQTVSFKDEIAIKREKNNKYNKDQQRLKNKYLQRKR